MSYGSMMAGRLHVSATRREVIRYVRSRIQRKYRNNRDMRVTRHTVLRDALAAHEANRAVYQSIYRGTAAALR